MRQRSVGRSGRDVENPCRGPPCHEQRRTDGGPPTTTQSVGLGTGDQPDLASARDTLRDNAAGTAAVRQPMTRNACKTKNLYNVSFLVLCDGEGCPTVIVPSLYVRTRAPTMFGMTRFAVMRSAGQRR